ncbi:unnamed protein product [Ascophyllum nodosum]
MRVHGKELALAYASFWCPSSSFVPSVQPSRHPLAFLEISVLFRTAAKRPKKAQRLIARSQPYSRRSSLDSDVVCSASAGLEGEEGPGNGAAPKQATTEEERKAEILRQVNQANYIVGSKMMTISSFGPDFEPTWNPREPARDSKTASSPPEKLPAETIEEQRRLFQKRKWRLIGDNVFLGLLGTSGAWCASVKAAASFGLGATLGTAYIVLLSRFVESLGSTDESGGISSGGGSARLVLAVLLVLIVSKNKETFELVPAVAGFLGYQISGLVQGIYTDFDELEEGEAL